MTARCDRRTSCLILFRDAWILTDGPWDVFAKRAADATMLEHDLGGYSVYRVSPYIRVDPPAAFGQAEDRPIFLLRVGESPPDLLYFEIVE